MNPLTIDRRPVGLYLDVWLVRRTNRRPIARHFAAGDCMPDADVAHLTGSAAPLHVFTIGARFALVVLWQRPAPDATATAGADRSGARP